MVDIHHGLFKFDVYVSNQEQRSTKNAQVPDKCCVHASVKTSLHISKSSEKNLRINLTIQF